MKSIIAVNNLGYIGLNNKLLWKSSQDMSHFIKMTINQRLLVGYNTAQDLPKLINRTIIIDDRDGVVTDADWCIGGKKTYEKYAPHFTELHISHIDNDDIGDIMFPDFRNLNPNCKIFNYYFK
jgi:dihydrofolate reductase